MTASLDVARMERDLCDLMIRSQNDEKMIALLKEQNAKQAKEIETMAAECAEKVRRLSQERDEAVQKATEVSDILDQAAGAVISGLRKMKGDEIKPAQEIARPNLAQLGKLPPNDEHDGEIRSIMTRIPRNELNA